jgi:hypothetical protein
MMTLFIKNIKHKSIAIILLLIMLVVVNGVGYAGNSGSSIFFTGSSLLSGVSSTGSAFAIIAGGDYKVIFQAPSDSRHISSLDFRVSAQNKKHSFHQSYLEPSKVIYDNEDSAYLWETQGSFEDGSVTGDYVVNVTEADGQYYEVATGKIPDIRASIQNSSSGDGSKVLQLTKACSEEVNIISIDDGEYGFIRTDFAEKEPEDEDNMKISLSGMEVGLIKPKVFPGHGLSCYGDICSDFLKVVYEVIGESSVTKRTDYVSVAFSNAGTYDELREQADRDAMFIPIKPPKSAKKPSAYITTKRDDGSSVTDLGSGLVQVGFAVPTRESKSTLKTSFDFYLDGANSKQTYRVRSSYASHSGSVDGFDLFAVVKEFENQAYAGSGAYSVISVDDSVSRSGDLPDLKVELLTKEPSCESGDCPEESKCLDGNECYKLRFTNHINRKIEVTGVEDAEGCRAELDKSFVIEPGEYHDLALYDFDASGDGYALPMDYKIIGEGGEEIDKDVHSVVRIVLSDKSWLPPIVGVVVNGVLCVGGGACIWKFFKPHNPDDGHQNPAREDEFDDLPPAADPDPDPDPDPDDYLGLDDNPDPDPDPDPPPYQRNGIGGYGLRDMPRVDYYPAAGGNSRYGGGNGIREGDNWNPLAEKRSLFKESVNWAARALDAAASVSFLMQFIDPSKNALPVHFFSTTKQFELPSMSYQISQLSILY